MELSRLSCSFPRAKKQVVGMIIEFVFVDMVDNFVRLQKPTQLFFHHQDVLHDVFAIFSWFCTRVFFVYNDLLIATLVSPSLFANGFTNGFSMRFTVSFACELFGC